MSALSDSDGIFYGEDIASPLASLKGEGEAETVEVSRAALVDILKNIKQADLEAENPAECRRQIARSWMMVHDLLESEEEQ